MSHIFLVTLVHANNAAFSQVVSLPAMSYKITEAQNNSFAKTIQHLQQETDLQYNLYLQKFLIICILSAIYVNFFVSTVAHSETSKVLPAFFEALSLQ